MQNLDNGSRLILKLSLLLVRSDIDKDFLLNKSKRVIRSE